MVKKIFVPNITVLFHYLACQSCTFLGTNYKFGYIDKEGNFVIEPQYGSVKFFRGLAGVLYGTLDYGKWGFMV